MTSLATPEELTGLVRAAVNNVADPCSIARGTPIGLVDMGLLVDLTITDSEDGASVALVLRITAPGCLYWTHFESAVSEEVLRIGGVAHVECNWHEDFDWMPSLMSPRARGLMTIQRSPERPLNPRPMSA